MTDATPTLTDKRLPTVIVLAAGRGERFAESGGQTHKLSAVLAGKTVLAHVLDAVRASGLPHHVVRPGPQAATAGMGDSIAAGVRATADAAGWLILPGDLPLIQAATLRQLALAPVCPVLAPVHGGQRGHPVRFSAACGPALIALSGEQGAASVVKAQQAQGGLTLLEVDDAGVVTDIDTLADLAAAQARLSVT